MLIAVDYTKIVKQTLLGWWEDKAPRLGAALAFYTMLSLAPILIIATPLASLVFGAKRSQEGIIAQFQSLVGMQGAAVVEAVIRSPYATTGGSIAAAVGVVVLVFGATGVFVELQDALNTIWEVAPAPSKGAIMRFVRQRLL